MISIFYQLDLNKKGKPVKLKITERTCSNPTKYLQDLSQEAIGVSDLWHAVRYWENKRFNINCINSLFVVDFKEMADRNSSLSCTNTQKWSQNLFLKLLQLFALRPKLEASEFLESLNIDPIPEGWFDMNLLLSSWSSQMLKDR